MAKQKMTVTLDPDLLAQIDTDASTAGLNRSEYVERALRNEYYRRLLARVDAPHRETPADQRRMRDMLGWQADPDSSAPEPAR